jgi:hypothetical protein
MFAEHRSDICFPGKIYACGVILALPSDCALRVKRKYHITVRFANNITFAKAKYHCETISSLHAAIAKTH